MTKDQAKVIIEKLVNRYAEQQKAYHAADYNETKTRRDFIDPFFKALGWDMDNEQDVAEPYREVIHEDKVKIQGKVKAPDYGFRLQGAKDRLFFVEAKKPSVPLKTNKEAAFQVRRYGWNSRVAVSILTNFEEFIVYDCSKKPNANDSTSVARLKTITYDQFLQEFDFIYDTFSREAVVKGRFDTYVKSDTAKKGTVTPDKDFVNSLEEWRRFIAIDIARNNLKLNEDELNFAVQLIIDRLIFLRFCEDRGVEHYGQLKSAVAKGSAYEQLHDIFIAADDKYNSGLFDFDKDKITQGLKVTNKVIKGIIDDMYYPLSQYDFKALPVEVLGNAYEQFLGKVIRINKAHHAVIEEKPEVRKAGGVFYTPQYIVDYIVENTVGKLIAGKTPKEIEKIKIVDPACGSGSFLLGAFDYLLKFHQNYYHQNPPSAKSGIITPIGTLSTAEKKKILLNNIYGVDLDANAVEVSKLSLLLKCMEGETEASIKQQITMFNERVLPDLDNNIKDGNSLVDTDIYDSELDFGEEKKIKPFSWKKQFPEIFKQGGFDAVIGNPPYVMLQNIETKKMFDYALNKFTSAKYKIDTYQLFTEQSILLLKEKGLLGFITPNTFLKNIHSEPLRNYILSKTTINEIILYKYSVFSGASVDTCTFIIEKNKATKKSLVGVKLAKNINDIETLPSIYQEQFLNNNRKDFNLLKSDNDSEALNTIQSNSIPLSSYCDAYFGIQTFDRETYVSTKKLNKHFEPVIDGGNIEPFFLKAPTEFVNFQPSSIKSGGNEKIYRQERICIRQIGSFPVSTIVPANIFTLNTIYNVYFNKENIISLKFILGIMNCNVVKFFWKKNNSDEKKTFPKIKKEAILSIPIPKIDKEKNKNQINDIVKAVELLFAINIELRENKIQSKIDQLKQRIEHTEDKLNKMAYVLYGLSPEEISVIEEAISK